MENLKNNNEEFFKEIIEIYQGQLFLIAKVRLKDDFLASDAVQETFVALYLNMHKIKKSEKLKSWMTKTLINKCNDIIRKNKIYSFNIEYENYEKYSASDEYENINKKIDILKFIETLNIQDKTIIVMYYSNNYTSKEISDILKINENTIKTKISRIKLKLKDFIMEDNNGKI